MMKYVKYTYVPVLICGVIWAGNRCLELISSQDDFTVGLGVFLLSLLTTIVVGFIGTKIKNLTKDHLE